MALTFIELLLAMAITALVGMAVAAMLWAVSYGTGSERDMRVLVVKQKLTTTRFTGAVRSAKMVLAQGADYLILWQDDTNSNSAPDLSEIQRIERDSSSEQLQSYQAPASLNPVNDVTYALTDDFNTITNAIKGSANFPLAVWARQVTQFDVTLNNADPQQAGFVHCQFTLATGNVSDVTISAAALRAR